MFFFKPKVVVRPVAHHLNYHFFEFAPNGRRRKKGPNDISMRVFAPGVISLVTPDLVKEGGIMSWELGKISPIARLYIILLSNDFS